MTSKTPGMIPLQSSHKPAQNDASEFSSSSLGKQEGTTLSESDTEENKQEACNYVLSPPNYLSDSGSSDPFLSMPPLTLDDNVQHTQDCYVQDDQQIINNQLLSATESVELYQLYFHNMLEYPCSSETVMDMHLESSMHDTGMSEQDYHSAAQLDFRRPSDPLGRLVTQDTKGYNPPSSANCDLLGSNDFCVLISVHPVPEDTRASGDRYIPGVVEDDDTGADSSSEHSYNLVSDRSGEASDYDAEKAESESIAQGPLPEESSCNKFGGGSYFLTGSTNHSDLSEANTVLNNCDRACFTECTSNPDPGYVDDTVYPEVIMGLREAGTCTSPTRERQLDDQENTNNTPTLTSRQSSYVSVCLWSHHILSFIFEFLRDALSCKDDT